MKYRKQGLFSKVMSSRVVLLILIVLFAFLTKVSFTMKERLELSKSKLNVANSELDKLINHQTDLANKIKYLSTDEGIEAELRTKYRAIRNGESVAVIIDSDKKATSTATSTGI